jgi:transcriptional regulator with XRE-family HTH domain
VAEKVETIAERLARLRLEQGLSIADLARAARTTEGAIRSLLNGTSKLPKFDTGLRLADALGVNPWYILGGLEYDPLESGLRLLEARLEALERLVLETVARDRHGYTSADPDDGGPRRTAPGSR